MKSAVLAVAVAIVATAVFGKEVVATGSPASPRQAMNLTGTITWKHDGGNRSSGGSIERQATMTINVNLKPDPSGLERAYVDDGSS